MVSSSCIRDNAKHKEISFVYYFVITVNGYCLKQQKTLIIYLVLGESDLHNSCGQNNFEDPML